MSLIALGAALLLGASAGYALARRRWYAEVRRFGDHRPPCPWWTGSECHPCTCGFLRYERR